MTLDNFFSKLEILWSDTMRWARIAPLLLLFWFWLILFLIWVLVKLGILPISLSSGFVTLLEYTTLVFVIIVKTFYVGVKYLQDIYEVPSTRHTWRYLIALIFEWNLPKLKIAGGQKVFEGDFNSIEHIGGPGILQIGRDNVVALETLQTQKNIMMAGERPINRFDFVKDILSTEEQYGKIDEIKTLTADGIQIAVQNVQFRFRIDGHLKSSETDFQMKDYIPFKKAVINLIYDRPVNVEGNPSVWTDAVSGTVTGVIREHVNNAYLDELIAPHDMDGHSLEMLRNQFISTKIQDRFKNMGVKLLSCNIGEIDVTSLDLEKERLKAWFAKQSGAIKVIRAQGDAESFASHERGRTEGQALLVKSIAHALQDIGIRKDDPASVRSNLRKILLTRTAQILESRSSVYHTHKEEDRNDSHKG